MNSNQHTLVDFLSKNDDHLNFNLSYISCLSDKDYDLLGIESHIKNHPLNPKAKQYSIKDKGQWVMEVISLFFLLLKKKKKNITGLAFENYIFPTLLLIFFPFFLNSKFTLVIHNNISPLKRSNLKRIPLKICTKFFKIKFLCLTKNGMETMKEMGFKNSHFIPHMNFNHQIKEIAELKTDFDPNKTNISLLGRQASLFVDYILPNLDLTKFSNLNFYVFKNVSIQKVPENLEIIPERLSNEEFSAVLKKSDFTIFPDVSVGYRPSGILLDAISNYCPIIAPLKGHFSEFKTFLIGEFYTENQSLEEILLMLNKTTVKRSNFEKSQFDAVLKKTSIETFKEKLNAFYSI